MSAPRETPILFTSPMMNAIIQGRKTQTRRLITRLRGFGKITEFGLTDTRGYHWHFRNRHALWNDVSRASVLAACPYGTPGDLLWCRETVRGGWWSDDGLGAAVHYLADNQARRIGNTMEAIGGWLDLFNYRGGSGLNVPAIHMPKWCCRQCLRLTEARIEPLQDIDEAGAGAEGFKNRVGFAAYIDVIHGDGTWGANPWVWVLTFERADGKNQDEPENRLLGEPPGAPPSC
jgi:hypothetical protein